MSDRIDSQYLQYHKSVIQEVKNVEAVKSHWFYFLAKEYGIKDSDYISESGEIIRSQPPKVGS